MKRWSLPGLLFTVFVLLTATSIPSSAQLVELMSKADSGLLSETPGGDSTPTSVSADGRFVVFDSSATNLVAGQMDTNPGNDVFLFDRVTGTTTLVSHVAGAPATTGGNTSSSGSISPDGAFVLFQSDATDLVAGQVDTNGTSDMFLFERATGTVTLVSHSIASPTTTGDAGSNFYLYPYVLDSLWSADGSYAVIVSWATDLVAGQVEGNGGADVFVYERATNSLSLVSHADGAATTTSDGESYNPRISADGNFIAFTSYGFNLVPGQVDSTFEDVFLFERATGLVTLVSHDPASAVTTPDNDSFGAQISADGSWVVFFSRANNLVPGQFDPNGGEDVFLFERATGTVTLVSHIPGNPTWTGDRFSGFNALPYGLALSADGAFVAFLSYAEDLVSGQLDVNGQNDLFLYDRATDSIELLSAIPGSTTETSLWPAVQLSMSPDGERVVFMSAGEDLVAGQTDGNSVNDVFLRDRLSGVTSLVSHAAGAPATAGDGVSEGAFLSGDGAFVAYSSQASDLVAGLSDQNNRYDVFLYDASAATNDVASRADGGAPTVSGNGASTTAPAPSRTGMSADGHYVLFQGSATNLVPGQVAINVHNDVFLYDRVADTVSLVSHAAGLPNVTGDLFSDSAQISADGNWVLFRSAATNLVPGQSGGGTNVFLWERATDSTTLVSHVPGFPTTAANSASGPGGLSADGAWVAFSSLASDLAPTDTNGTWDIFLYERATGNITVVSHVPGMPGTTANGFSPGARISLDGNWVSIQSRATNLVTGQVDGLSSDDAFLYHRPTDTMTLVSRAAGTTTTTGNGASTNPSVSFDGSYVVFRSGATNVIVGQVDTNGKDDLFLFDVGLGTTSLISHQTGAPTTTGDFDSLFYSMSDDASYVAFQSRATNLVPGQVFGTFDDIFVHERATGLNALVSRQDGTIATEGDGASDTPVISGDGNWIGFRSAAKNLAAGQIDDNNVGDVFLHDRVSGTTSVVSLKAATIATTGNSFSDGTVLGQSGDYVAFRSAATDLVPSDFNGNADAFLYSRLTATTDLEVTKDDGQTTAVPGNPISYVITVTNNGPTALTSVVLNDSVPAEIQSPVFAPSAGVYTEGTGDWTGLTLAPGNTVTMTLSGTVAPNARGTLDNSVTAFPTAPVVDPLPANNTAVDSDSLTPQADVGIVKSDSPDPVDSGAILTYTLTVTNYGPSEATGIVVTDILPNVTFVSSTPGSPTCNESSGVVTCNLGTLAPSAATVVTIDVIANFLGLSNGANVTAVEPDPDTSNNIDTEPTIVNVPGGAVRFFTAKSTSGTNRLEWINPAPGDYLATHVLVKTTGFPANETDGTVLVNGGTAGAMETYEHTGLTDGTVYYYAAYVERGSGFSAGRFTSGRPFDDSGPVKWAFTTGATSMAPPSIGSVYAASNDRVLHSLTPGPLGGDWSLGWTPFEAPEPVQSRSPVVPVAVSPATKVVFVGAQDGHVYAIDADTGSVVWTSPLLGERVQAAPAGMFSDFGGTWNLILVGSWSSSMDDVFYGLNLLDGMPAWTFDNLSGSGGIGVISGGASVDYDNDRVYFASRARSGGSSSTVWCLDFTGASATLRWERDVGNVDGSPILLGTKVYVGTNGSEVHALNADNGSDLWSAPFGASDGPIKNFVWPERGATDLYFSTTNRVWSISDDGTSASLNWMESSIPSPSTPLYYQGVDLLFVGSSDGRLYQLDVSVPTPTLKNVVLGDGAAAVGIPSLDILHNMIYVGTDAGILYAIQLPLP